MKSPLINLILVFCVFSGCASLPDAERIVYLPGKVSLLSEVEKSELYQPEIAANAEYEIGVSLSGGGMRSASFAVGALAGLADMNILQQTDFVSTVSGGGYTGYWLLSNLYFADLKNTQKHYANFFNDCYPIQFNLYEDSDNYLYSNCQDEQSRKSEPFMFQNQIAQQSDLLNYYQDTDPGSARYRTMQLQQYSEYVTVAAAQILSLLPHHLGNTLFDWGWNVSALKHTYKNGIERAFGLVPINLNPNAIDEKVYQNSDPLLWMNNYSAAELTFDELKKYTIKQLSNCSKQMSIEGECTRPPIWIINSTAGVADRTYEWLDVAPLLSDSVFETSPLMYGSGEYGYIHDAFYQLDVASAVAASGAAMDVQFTSETMAGWSRFFIAAGLHAVNFDLGESIQNYNPNSADPTLHSFLPFPLYYLHGFSRNKSSTDIYLSDGGHSENLGAYSLIVRGVKNVIIVDAEHDEFGKWGALKMLANSLQKEHGLNLTIDGKDLSGEVIEHPQHSTENIYIGRVTGYREGFVKDGDYINIVYVKSSLIEKFLSPDCVTNNLLYPCSTYLFYKDVYLKSDGKGKCIPKRVNDPFPNHNTAFTAGNMSLDIYFAYRDLARHMTRRISMKDGNLVVEPLPDISDVQKPVC